MVQAASYTQTHFIKGTVRTTSLRIIALCPVLTDLRPSVYVLIFFFFTRTHDVMRRQSITLLHQLESPAVQVQSQCKMYVFFRSHPCSFQHFSPGPSQVAKILLSVTILRAGMTCITLMAYTPILGAPKQLIQNFIFHIAFNSDWYPPQHDPTSNT